MLKFIGRHRTRILFFSIIIAGLVIIAGDVISEYLKSYSFKFDYFQILSIGFLAYAILAWRDTYFYGIVAIYFLIELPLPLTRVLRLLSLPEITELPMVQLGLALNVVIILFSIVIISLATNTLLLHFRQRKRLSKISDSALIKDYFESALSSQKYQNKRDIDAKDKASNNARWDLYELERRDKHLGELAKALSSKDVLIREKAAKEIFERFGEEPLRPLQEDSEENRDRKKISNKIG